MQDDDVLTAINRLADEEHTLLEHGSHGEISEAECARLKDIEVRLDQCWDLLHQRRARRRAGLDPDEATVRDAGTVEGYVD